MERSALKDADEIIRRLRHYIALILKGSGWTLSELGQVKEDLVQSEFLQYRIRECLALMKRRREGRPDVQWLDHNLETDDKMTTEEQIHDIDL